MDKQLIDILWVTVSASLVFLMQGGFLCLETGLTRSNFGGERIPSVEDLSRGWDKHVEAIARIHEKFRKPVIISATRFVD